MNEKEFLAAYRREGVAALWRFIRQYPLFATRLMQMAFLADKTDSNDEAVQRGVDKAFRKLFGEDQI